MTSLRERAEPGTTSPVLALATTDEADAVAGVGVSGLCSTRPDSGVVVMVGMDNVGVVGGKPDGAMPSRSSDDTEMQGNKEREVSFSGAYGPELGSERANDPA